MDELGTGISGPVQHRRPRGFPCCSFEAATVQRKAFPQMNLARLGMRSLECLDLVS
jgi:hypothetical protein